MAKTTRPVGRWELSLSLEPDASRTPTFARIAHALTEDVRRGRLRPGARLPGSRTLAEGLGVHRNTVLAAYRALMAEGWIEARPGRGTFVSEALPTTPPRRFSRAPIDPVARRERLGFPLEGERPKPPTYFAPKRGLLTMFGGVPDARLIPVEALARAYRRQLRRGAQTLTYGDPKGHPALRRAFAAMLAETRGLAIDESDVLVTRGSQMALLLAARVVLRPGDRVAVEAWGYRPAWEALRLAGAELVPVPVDAHGLDVDALAARCAEERIAAVYLTPHHQYPTTVSLSPGRRLALLALARAHRFAIFEDDYDHEFHYEGRPLLPLASADTHGNVVYIGTLSKVLAPGLRLGYLSAPRPLLERAVELRWYVDRQGDLATEAAVAELIEDGELQRHVRRARRVYHRRRDRCVDALTARFGDRLSFAVPSGGMALWARCQAGVDVDAWYERAVAGGVAFQPARHFAFDGRSRPYLRLGYACLDDDELVEAVSRLHRAMPDRSPRARRRAAKGTMQNARRPTSLGA
jgi:GntR family transcriptional regulator / MocR family aminotransferase